MENTSKALLIAASVLIVILIIAVSMRIFNVNDGIAEDAKIVGESISSETTKATDEAINILEKNLIRIKDSEIKVKEDNYYSEIKTKLILEPNTTYELSFDYKVIDKPVGNKWFIRCGIGYGEDLHTVLKEVDYVKGTEEAGKQGKFVYKVTTDSKLLDNKGVEVKKPYLKLRLVRIQYVLEEGNNIVVAISNVKFIKVK